jgi:hypothetical protein
MDLYIEIGSNGVRYLDGENRLVDIEFVELKRTIGLEGIQQHDEMDYWEVRVLFATDPKV